MKAAASKVLVPVLFRTVPHGDRAKGAGSLQPSLSLLPEQEDSTHILLLTDSKFCVLGRVLCSAMCSVSVTCPGGGHGEESGGLPVCSGDASLSPLHLHGWSLLHCCTALGLHTHEAQVHLSFIIHFFMLGITAG